MSDKKRKTLEEVMEPLSLEDVMEPVPLEEVMEPVSEEPPDRLPVTMTTFDPEEALGLNQRAPDLLSMKDIKTAAVETPKAFVRGVEQGVGTAGTLAQWMAERDTFEDYFRKKYGTKEYVKSKNKVAAMGERWADWWDEQANKGWEKPSDEILNAKWSKMPLAKTTTTIAEAAPSYLTAIASSVLTKNPQVGLTILSAQAGASQYRRHRKKDVPPGRASVLAAMTGAWEYVTEKIPFEAVFKPAKSLFNKMLKIGTMEAAQEFIQGIGENFLEYFGYEAKDLDSVPNAVKEGLEHTLDGWAENLVAGAGLGIMGAGAGGKSGRISPEQIGPVKSQITRHLEEASKPPPTEMTPQQVEEAIAQAEKKEVAEEEAPAEIPPQELEPPPEEAKPPVAEVPPAETTPETPPVETTPVEVPPVETLPPRKAEPVQPVLAPKMVSPGEAGPFKITFPGTEQLPQTRIIEDPKIRRIAQGYENRIAQLKTRLKQARADRNVALQRAIAKEVAKRQAQLDKLRARMNVKLVDTVNKANVKLTKLKNATKFKDSLRRDAISLVRSIPKEMQPDFVKRAAEADTLGKVKKLTSQIEEGIKRAEKKQSITNLRKAVKRININKMLPEHAAVAKSLIDSLQVGKPRAETTIKNSDLKDMARQVIETSSPDSVASRKAEKLLDDLNKKTSRTVGINKLSKEAIDDIADVLIAAQFQNEADTIAAKGENAEIAKTRREEMITAIKPGPARENIFTRIKKKFKLLHSNMESVCDSVTGGIQGTYDKWADRNSPFTKYIYDVLNAGVDRQIEHNREARRIMMGILKDHNVTTQEILNWSVRPEDMNIIKKAKGIVPKFFKFRLGGKVHTFTVSELMFIYMDTRNSYNLDVLMNEGMDRMVRGKKQKLRGFTSEVIDDMVATLTPRQKSIAIDVGVKLMDGLNKNAINDTSVRLEFFPIANVDNYWSARRSKVRTPKGKQLQFYLKTVEGMGLLKERVGGHNPLILNGFFETVYATNKHVAAYVGLAEPLREVKSVYNEETIEALEDSDRADEAKLITDLITRFEDQSLMMTPMDKLVKRMIGGFAKSRLYFRPHIAARQQISSFLISAYVDDIHLITGFKGAATQGVKNEIAGLCPQFAQRAEMLQFDRDVGDAFLNNELLHYMTGHTSMIDKTAMGLKYFDTNAIADVYRTAKHEVMANNPGLDINSPEGKALLKQRFEWLARHTQPMWHVKDRSQLGSDPHPLWRALTMFMSQREQLVRMVNNSIEEYNNSKKGLDDLHRLGKSIGAVGMNMALFTIFNYLWYSLALKREKEPKELPKRFLADLLSLPFFGKYFATGIEMVYDVFVPPKGYKIQGFNEGIIEGIFADLITNAMPNYAKAARDYVSGEKYQSGPYKYQKKWKRELKLAVDATVQAFSSIFGVPYYGAKEVYKVGQAQVTEKK